MTAAMAWRGPFASDEVYRLHAGAFGTRVHTAGEWDWELLVLRHSLGWVTARQDGELVGFVNVVWDGGAHAWLQDTMVATTHHSQGIGRQLVERAGRGARETGCEWLHVDFEDRLRSFYVDACGFTPTAAGLMRLWSG